jgi:hypothetical protein
MPRLEEVDLAVFHGLLIPFTTGSLAASISGHIVWPQSPAIIGSNVDWLRVAAGWRRGRRRIPGCPYVWIYSPKSNAPFIFF